MTNPDGSSTGYDDVGASGYGGVAALLGGFYDTTISSQTARKNTDKTIEAQRAEAEKAYQRQVEMWHMQNAYNSPAEQMKRFGAAGLNPHLIYGQGSTGNASKFPEYQAPNLQYRYEAPAYGAASANAIQQLMQVGTWMQNMKLSEQEIQSKDLAIDFLGEVNPRKLTELDNRLSMYPYQSTMQRALAQKSHIDVASVQQEFQHKFGKEAASELSYDPRFGRRMEPGGIRQLEYLEQAAKTKLAGAKASWADWSITDPQALMQLVLGGVMGMAGTTLRLNTKSRNVAPVKQIGKGQPGRWSMPAKRWIPTKNWRGQWKSETP